MEAQRIFTAAEPGENRWTIEEWARMELMVDPFCHYFPAKKLDGAIPPLARF